MYPLSEKILEQSLAIRTTVLPEVRSVIDQVSADWDGVVKYNTSIVNWLKPIIDLTDWHVYPRNGITEGLDWWYDKEQRSVYMDSGDYQWITPKGNMYEDGVQYLSTPSAIDGNWRLQSPVSPHVLDLAYVGSTSVQRLDVSANCERVFYSFSKPFGVRNVRTGWMFTRTPDQRLEALTHSAKYYNYYANAVSEAIISNFDIDYVHRTLKSSQKKVCDSYGFEPSDSVWLALTTDQRYSKFIRDKVARLCLAPCF